MAQAEAVLAQGARSVAVLGRRNLDRTDHPKLRQTLWVKVLPYVPLKNAAMKRERHVLVVGRSAGFPQAN